MKKRGKVNMKQKIIYVFLFITILFFSCNKNVTKQNVENDLINNNFDDIEFNFPLTTITEISEYLNRQTIGITKEDPIYLQIQIDLENMLFTTTGWYKLLDLIDKKNRYISLDLSECDMDGKIFRPDSIFGNGPAKIVSLILPKKAISIESGMLTHPVNGIAIFRYFENLTSVKGENILIIGSNAFEDCINLKNIYFPMAKTIGNGAFSGCIELSNISFPEVLYIEARAFTDCTKLTDIFFPMAIIIGEESFSRCVSLKEVNFPNVKNILNFAFEDCIGLEKAYFPELNSIGSTFYGCIKLEEITISAATEGFNSSTFYNCTNLTKFNLTGSGYLSIIESGRVLVKNNTILIAYPSASGNITMEDVTEIGNGAFAGCIELTSVSFPLATKIGGGAFLDCTNLYYIYFPIVREIFPNAFKNCINLINANFPQVSRILYYAFSGCINLVNLNIPSIREIRAYVFGSTGSKALTIMMGLRAPSIDTIYTFRETPFQNDVLITKDVIIKIPAGAQGYTPFSGTTVTITGVDNQDNWVNRLRGFGVSHIMNDVDGNIIEVYSDPNPNITVTLIQISE